MHRRTFLFHGTLGSAALLAGCSSVHVPGDPIPDAGATHDGSPLLADAASFRDAALGGALVITAPFEVLLNDTTCSHNGHTCFVEQGSWDDDVEISFLGGSHEVRFFVSELVLLQAGERIPFATVGPGPGHAHCGTAWRREVGPFDDTLVDACEPRGTARCELHRT